MRVSIAMRSASRSPTVRSSSSARFWASTASGDGVADGVLGAAAGRAGRRRRAAHRRRRRAPPAGRAGPMRSVLARHLRAQQRADGRGVGAFRTARMVSCEAGGSQSRVPRGRGIYMQKRNAAGGVVRRAALFGVARGVLAPLLLLACVPAIAVAAPTTPAIREKQAEAEKARRALDDMTADLELVSRGVQRGHRGARAHEGPDRGDARGSRRGAATAR